MSADEHISINIGDEHNERLWDVLKDILMKFHAVKFDRSWNMGGSQELDVYKVAIGKSTLIIEAETYVGLTISGPSHLVQEISQNIQSQMAYK